MTDDGPTQLTFDPEQGCGASITYGPAASSLRWSCTRDAGHDGDHVAHGMVDQELVRWPQQAVGA